MVELAFGTNCSSMGKHNVLGDGQSKSGAARFARAGFVNAIEAFEKARQMLGRNAGSEVLDVELDLVMGAAGTEDNPPS